MRWPWDSLIHVWRGLSLEEAKAIAEWMRESISELKKNIKPDNTNYHSSKEILKQARSANDDMQKELLKTQEEYAWNIQQVTIALFKMILISKGDNQSKPYLQEATGGWDQLRSWWRQITSDEGKTIAEWMLQSIENLQIPDNTPWIDEDTTVEDLVHYAKQYTDEIKSLTDKPPLESSEDIQIRAEQITKYLTDSLSISHATNRAKETTDEREKETNNGMEKWAQYVAKRNEESLSDIVKRSGEDRRKQLEVNQDISDATKRMAVATVVIALATVLSLFFNIVKS